MLWIKMFPAKSLRGSLRFDLPYNLRGIWYELLLMAGDSNPDGFIHYPKEFIASQLGCPIKVLDDTLNILIKTERITIKGNEIAIVNWNKYQYEKQRYPVGQKPYSKRNTPADTADPARYAGQKHEGLVKH